MSSNPFRRAPSRTRGPLREGPDQKRLRILAAARGVCAREGYEAATMDAVAAEARVSKGTLYNHFDGKEHLFLSTVLQAYDDAEARIDARLGSAGDPHTRLDVHLEALVEAFPHVAAGMMVNLQIWAVVARDAEARRRMFEDLSARYRRSGDDLEATLAAGRRSGALRGDFDPGAVAAGLLAVFDGFVYRSVFDPDRGSAEGLRAALDALIRERVLPGDAERGEAGPAPAGPEGGR